MSALTPIILTWLCFKYVPNASSISNSRITGKTTKGATSSKSPTFKGNTQPQGEPKGVVVSGSLQLRPHSEEICF